VLGVKHPKWDERPVLIVQLAQGAKATKEEIIAFLTPRLGKWQIPDDVLFVDALPMTATGKISKLQLRQKLADYKLPATPG
jgi:fatty-acyl-CoA synthase